MTSKTEAKIRHRIASELYHPVRNRKRALTKWVNEGRVKVDQKWEEYSLESFVTVLVGTLVFQEPKGHYPSEKLFAQVALAVEAGQGFPPLDWIDTRIEDFKLDDPVSLTPIQWERLKLP